MANIRIQDLPNEASPSASDEIAIDGLTTRKTTLENAVAAGRPVATQPEAEAGVNNTKAMTPLTTKQAIDAIGGAQFATSAQGGKADTALQPSAIGSSVQAYSALLSSVSGLSIVSQDLIVGSGAGTVARLPKGTDGQVLSINAGNVAWRSVASASAVSYVPQSLSASEQAQARNNITVSTHVDDRTALKALDPTKDTVVYLKEAGREGVFVWRTGDYSTQVAADTQEGIYIKADGVAATVGAWVRQFDGVYWLHWFGVVGDGTTDDQPAIQATIDTVQALGGGRLMGRVGAHRCADTVTVSGTAPITIQGATAAIPAFGESGDTDSSFTLVFDVADGTDGVVFENASTRIDGASIKDVFIYRNTLEAITGTGLTGGRGLKVLGVVNPRFENVHIHNFAIDFEVSDIAAGPTSGGSFDKIRCSTAARMQALIRGAIDVSFNDCIFGGREGGNTYNGLLTWSDHSRRPNACHFTNCMFIESGGVRPTNNLRIVNGFWNHFTNCVFERANDQHIRVIYDVALGGSIIGTIFTGCHSNDPSITSVLIDGEVSNIHLLNSRWHQSNAGASPNACVRIEHASKALTSHKILGCQIRFETYGGIRINNAQGVIVSNNSIYGSGSGDGIILHSNSEKCIATQNVFSGVGAAVNNIGSGNVVANNVTI